MDVSNQPIQTAGINDVYEYNEVHLSSLQRDGGDNDHPFWNIQPELHSVLGAKVLSAQIPYSFYTIVDSGPARNNLLDIRTAEDTVHSVTLPAGVYTAEQLRDALESPDNNTGAAPALAVSWTVSTGKYTFGNALAGDVTLLLENNPIAYILGLEPKDLPLPADGTVVAPSVANVSGPNCLYIVSNAISGRISRNVRCNGNTTVNPAVVAKVPLTVNFGEVVDYTDPNPAPCFDMSMDTLTRLDFALINADTLQPVDLNGAPWSLTLQVLAQRDTAVTRARDDSRQVGRKRLRS